jgi:hypothetical protein
MRVFNEKVGQDWRIVKEFRQEWSCGLLKGARDGAVGWIVAMHLDWALTRIDRVVHGRVPAIYNQ